MDAERAAGKRHTTEHAEGEECAVGVVLPLFAGTERNAAEDELAAVPLHFQLPILAAPGNVPRGTERIHRGMAGAHPEVQPGMDVGTRSGSHQDDGRARQQAFHCAPPWGYASALNNGRSSYVPLSTPLSSPKPLSL